MVTTEYCSTQTGSKREAWPAMGSHTKNMSEMERTISMAGGTALALLGLSRMPKTSLILLAGGLYAIYRGMNGHCHMYEQLGIDHSDQ